MEGDGSRASLAGCSHVQLPASSFALTSLPPVWAGRGSCAEAASARGAEWVKIQGGALAGDITPAPCNSSVSPILEERKQIHHCWKLWVTQPGSQEEPRCPGEEIVLIIIKVTKTTGLFTVSPKIQPSQSATGGGKKGKVLDRENAERSD